MSKKFLRPYREDWVKIEQNQSNHRHQSTGRMTLSARKIRTKTSSNCFLTPFRARDPSAPGSARKEKHGIERDRHESKQSSLDNAASSPGQEGEKVGPHTFEVVLHDGVDGGEVLQRLVAPTPSPERPRLEERIHLPLSACTGEEEEDQTDSEQGAIFKTVREWDTRGGGGEGLYTALTSKAMEPSSLLPRHWTVSRSLAKTRDDDMASRPRPVDLARSHDRTATISPSLRCLRPIGKCRVEIMTLRYSTREIHKM